MYVDGEHSLFSKFSGNSLSNSFELTLSEEAISTDMHECIKDSLLIFSDDVSLNE